MFAYFIDDWLSGRKYRKQTDTLDLLLTQHGLMGRRINLSRLHDLDASVEECGRSGVRTFVAVGNDATASKLLNCLLKHCPPHCALAVLPIGSPQTIARCLGAVSREEAVAMLARRQTRTIDLGLLNRRHYFITAATFPVKITLEFDSFAVTLLADDRQVSICNTNIFNEHKFSGQKNFFNPGDGLLEVVIAQKVRPRVLGMIFAHAPAPPDIESIFVDDKITVRSKEKTIVVQADTDKQLSTPIQVEVAPAALAVVVGPKNSLCGNTI